MRARAASCVCVSVSVCAWRACFSLSLALFQRPELQLQEGPGQGGARRPSGRQQRQRRALSPSRQAEGVQVRPAGAACPAQRGASSQPASRPARLREPPAGEEEHLTAPCPAERPGWRRLRPRGWNRGQAAVARRRAALSRRAGAAATSQVCAPGGLSSQRPPPAQPPGGPPGSGEHRRPTAAGTHLAANASPRGQRSPSGRAALSRWRPRRQHQPPSPPPSTAPSVDLPRRPPPACRGPGRLPPHKASRPPSLPAPGPGGALWLGRGLRALAGLLPLTSTGALARGCPGCRGLRGGQVGAPQGLFGA